MQVDPERVIADLRELAALTSDANGAQRLCWSEEWLQMRRWYRLKLEQLPVQIEQDEAGNLWATLPGADPARALVIGSHNDSIINGGWLDGVLGVLSGLEILRAQAATGTPPISLKLVDWADEEGARFATGCFGSGCAGGRFNVQAARDLKDRYGMTKAEAMLRCGVDLDHALECKRMITDAMAYLELHIEQGPVLESMDLPLGVVMGTFGVERHALTFTGQAAHAGATPMELRNDAFMAAARVALEARDICMEIGGVTTTGRVVNTPGLVTVLSGETVMTLDQRNFDENHLALMLEQVKKTSRTFAEEEGCSVSWHKTWGIAPVHFHPELIALCEQAVMETAGVSHRLPSGPLHDAAEMSMAGVPTVMMFVQSLRGLSHAKEEDTKPEHLHLAINAFALLAQKTLRWLG